MGGYDLIAQLIVLAIPIGIIAIVVGLVVWARDALARDPLVARVGLFVTAMAVVQLLVPRNLSGELNRPIAAVFLSEGHAQRAGVASVAVVLLSVVATSVAVRRGQALASAR